MGRAFDVELSPAAAICVDRADYSHFLVARRKQLGLTRSAVAKASGLRIRDVWEHEFGGEGIFYDESHVQKLATGLGVCPDALKDLYEREWSVCWAYHSYLRPRRGVRDTADDAGSGAEY